ncbi:MAG TPA: DUF1569 domain-containing protein [Acidisarcina sp.]|nr:DUF1569 domain-containing protein [Acidisarcina sp.]
MHPILQNVENLFHSVLGSVDAEEAQVHPGGNLLRWNVQQVVEHLILTYQLTSTTLTTRLEKRRPTAAKCTSLEWWLQMVVLSLGRMPKGASAPPETVPPQSSLPLSGRELAWKLSSEAEKMDELLSQCRTMFGLQRVASHQILGPLRVDQWRRFHVIHGLHHLDQIQRILAEAPTSHLPRQATPVLPNGVKRSPYTSESYASPGITRR